MAEKKRANTTKNRKSADYNASLLKAVNDVLDEYRKENWDMRLRILALQLLLQEQGLMAGRDVEAKFEELRKRFQPTRAAFRAEMRRLLVSFEGPKQ